MLAQINSGGAELTSRRSRKGNWEEENATTVLHFAVLHFGIQIEHYLVSRFFQFFVRVWVFWPRCSRGLKTGEDKRHVLGEVHIKFLQITNLFSQEQKLVQAWRTDSVLRRTLPSSNNMLMPPRTSKNGLRFIQISPPAGRILSK
jgi:hypothetical protein